MDNDKLRRALAEAIGPGANVTGTIVKGIVRAAKNKDRTLLERLLDPICDASTASEDVWKVLRAFGILRR